MTNMPIYMEITDEQRERLAAWKAANADNPAFHELMASCQRAYNSIVKIRDTIVKLQNGGVQ